MMSLATFYWKPRAWGKAAALANAFSLGAKRTWMKGNAGDLFTEALLRHRYQGVHIRWAKNHPGRLLVVGSIAHLALPGDVVAGIGVRDDNHVPSLPRDLEVIGLRGPRTYEVFRQQGIPLEGVRFLYDPGLLLGKLLHTQVRAPERNQVVFIPHYRERQLVKNLAPREFRILNVDQDPIELGLQIGQAELVFSSSLHGLIFAHAVGRPAVFVQPMTEEPMFKYLDYFDSISWKPKIIDRIDEANFFRAPLSAPNLPIIDLDHLPDWQRLKELGVTNS
jgi:hypothetical protein